MNPVEHTYRVFKNTWGICIKIIAEYTSLSNSNVNDRIIDVCDGVKLAFAKHHTVGEDTLTEGDIGYLMDGLKKVSSQILSASMYKKDTVIVIHSVHTAPCDFQEEGLAAAVMEWASIAFDFPTPPIVVSFNHERSKYEFFY